MLNISELIFEHQISMFGHVARLFSDDPAHRILCCGNPVGWKRGRGRPLSTWLRQMEEFCRRFGTDKEWAWALDKEDVLAYRDSWRGAAKVPLSGVQAPHSK